MELWSTLPPRGCWGRPGKWAPGRAEAPRQPAPAGPGVRGAGRMPGQWREQSFCLPLRRPCPTSLRLGQGGKQGGGRPPPPVPQPCPGPGRGATPVPPAHPGTLRVCGGEGTRGSGRGRARRARQSPRSRVSLGFFLARGARPPGRCHPGARDRRRGRQLSHLGFTELRTGRPPWPWGVPPRDPCPHWLFVS